MEIIGLSGYARSGKDEAAKVLVEEYGFVRVAFADKLREVLYALNPVVSIENSNYGGEWYHSTTERGVLLQGVIDEYGWNGYKETVYGPEIRRLLQRLGTEAGRQTLWDSIWVDAAFAGLDEDAKVVVTDARFPNEAEAITERGGQMWRIVREGVGPNLSADGTAHASETSLDDWEFDHTLGNTKTLEYFQEQVSLCYKFEKLKEKAEAKIRSQQ